MKISLQFYSRYGALLVFATSIIWPAESGRANEEIGFIETFALSTDRKASLSELIPGTEDFYFYSALVAQQEGRLGDVAALLEPWQKRHGETSRYIEIRHRQALLEYSDAPEKTLAYLKKHLGLSFNHQQQKLDAKPDYPVALKPGLINWDAFRKNAIRSGNSLSGVTDRGLDRLIRDQVTLSEGQRRDLLQRLKYPDYERLVGLIAADLRTRASQGFGEFQIHRSLTLDQLNELAGLRPELVSNPKFVNVKLTRLLPDADVSLEQDEAARQSYLERLWNYVKELEPAFNSLKTNALYQRLQLARQNGEYPREMFLEYLGLPRPMGYVEPRYLQGNGVRDFLANLGEDYSSTTGFPPVGNDEKLVREYLEHFFLEDASYNRFSPYIRETYLKQVFAETKLLNGIGPAEKWYSMLDPSQVQTLKDQIEIGFNPTNSEHFAEGDGVSLNVRLKHVDELIVKVYEINPLNYYLDQKRELNTDLNLDGLVANEEKTYRYSEAPIRRHTETFSFESIANLRGVWVIEFIGNGISSRALVRKGKLQYVSQSTPGGELVTVLTEANEKIVDSAVWFGGKRYDADKNGRVLLPFSTSGEVAVVLTDGELASFAKIDLPGEKYALDGGILLEQETLLPGSEATIAIRPKLSLMGSPVPIGLLDKVRLVVATVDHDGVDSISEVEGFELFDDRESLHTFRVPSRLSHISVSLTGEVESLSDPANPVECEFSRDFSINGVDQVSQVSDAYLSRLGDAYVIEHLGKSGEALPDRALTVEVKHRDFDRSLKFSLKTDEDGRVTLGSLTGIESVVCVGAGFGRRQWNPSHDSHSMGGVIHAAVGDPVVIPVAGLGPKLLRSDIAVFEVRNGQIVRDMFEKAAADSGAVELAGLDPGDYRVVLRNSDRMVRLRVTRVVKMESGYALSESRHLQLLNTKPLHISSLRTNAGKVEVTLANADEFTRVHVVATRFLPQFDLFEELNRGHRPAPVEISRGSNESLYVSGRDIGEEYRYILERRSAKRFPGNLLGRPGIILNPWALSETSTTVEVAEKGDAYGREKDMKEAKRKSAPGSAHPVISEDRSGDHSRSLEFLGDQALVVSNIEVGEDGTISLDLKDLGDRQHLHVIAVNTYNTAYSQLALQEAEGGTRFRDLRLRSTLNLEKSFTQRRNVTLLKDGEPLVIKDLRAAEIETYDTIGQVFGTLMAINPDDSLSTFRFITGWPGLDEGGKRALYSENACHELNFFLSRKDPKFFKQVVQPYLTNKKDKTFIDYYLTDSALDHYLAPWEFSRLNVVERILLAQRLGDSEREKTAGHIQSLKELLPPDPQRDAMFFRQALRGRRADNNGGVMLSSGMAEGVADPFGGREQDGMADAFAASGNSRGMQKAPGAGKKMKSNLALRSASVASDPFAAPAPASAMVADVAAITMGFEEAEELGDLRSRGRSQSLFRKLESTKEWAENNYYHLPIAAQNGDLIQVNAFWDDYATWNGEGGFYSREFPAASNSFTEMMFVLSVMDLPFESEQHEFTVEDNVMTLSAKAPVVVFHEEIQEAPISDEETPILVSQNFFRSDDRFRYVDGQRVDRFVTDEFLTGVIYGGQVVVTNPTSSAHQLDLLVQIPEGAIPVAGSDYTKSFPLSLSPFSTQRQEVLFYFSAISGDAPFAVYPVQVAKNEEIIASGSEATFNVVDQLTRFDEASWEYLSQFGTEKDVLNYLTENNLERTDLGLIAWRARENVDFFKKATQLIASRHAYDQSIWSYGVFHNLLPQAREFLKYHDGFLSQCGSWIDCELVSLDPVDRHWYQHLEYAPLVNARTNQLGRERKILNNRFHAQYLSLLKVLSYKPALPVEDRLAVSGYLLLQERIEEGLAWHESIEGDQLAERLQYDYLTAYAAFYREKVGQAKGIAAEYSDYPVERWRKLFASVALQVEAIEGEGVPESDEEMRENQLENLSSDDQIFELTAVGREAKLVYRNLESVTVNYYEMDLEFLFSSKPFVSGDSGQFSYIKPNLSETKVLDGKTDSMEFPVPKAFASKNVLVEVIAGGKAEAVAIYSNALKVQLSENYGRLEIRHEESGEPLSKTYVKVYARMKDGSVKFFKDGYTDLRGKFDYVSLNTNELDNVDEISLLIMSDEHGSLVRSADPPQR